MYLPIASHFEKIFEKNLGSTLISEPIIMQPVQRSW